MLSGARVAATRAPNSKGFFFFLQKEVLSCFCWEELKWRE
jgi:hypothetical protein